MSYKSRWSNGSWNVICDVCGRKFKDGELQMRWDNLMVCSRDWEPRQPQDFVRGVADVQAPPFTRPEQEDQFIPFNWTQYPQDSLTFTESLAKIFVKLFGGRILDAISSLGGNALNAIALNASVASDKDVEQLSIVETIRFVLGRFLTESMSMTESVAKRLTKAVSESISISESLRIVDTETTIESLSFSEVLAKKFGASKAESLSITESLAKQVTRVLSDAPSITEAVAKVFTRPLTSENIPMSETTVKTIGKVAQEAIGVVEALSFIRISPTVLNGAGLNSIRLN